MQHEAGEGQEIQTGGDFFTGEMGALGAGKEAVVRGSRRANDHRDPSVLALLWPL